MSETGINLSHYPVMEILEVILLSRQKQKVNQDLTNMSPTYPPDNYRITPTYDKHVLRTSYFSTASYSTISVTAATHPPVKLAGMSSKPKGKVTNKFSCHHLVS